MLKAELSSKSQKRTAKKKAIVFLALYCVFFLPALGGYASLFHEWAENYFWWTFWLSWHIVALAVGVLGFALLGILATRRLSEKETTALRRLYPTESGLLVNRTILLSLVSILIACVFYFVFGRLLSRGAFPVYDTSGHDTLQTYYRDHFWGNTFGSLVGTAFLLLCALKSPFLRPQERKRTILPIVMTGCLVYMGGHVFPLLGNRFIDWLTSYRYSVPLSQQVLLNFMLWLIVVAVGFGVGVPFAFHIAGIQPTRLSDGGKIVGEQIRAKRKELGLSQENLAQELSISRTYLTKIETNKANLTPDLAKAIEKSLGIELNYEAEKGD